MTIAGRMQSGFIKVRNSSYIPLETSLETRRGRGVPHSRDGELWRICMYVLCPLLGC